MNYLKLCNTIKRRQNVGKSSDLDNNLNLRVSLYISFKIEFNLSIFMPQKLKARDTS